MVNSRVLSVALALGALLSTDVAAQVPTYRIVRTEDLSLARVRRLNVRVAVPRHYARAEVEAIAADVVAGIVRRQEVNAISLMFFGPGTSTNGAWNVASVDWAPNGQWSDAGNVQPGDYSTFVYSTTWRPPPQTVRSSGQLSASVRRGLLGAPLPVGAVLIERTSGDRASGRDPSERYRVRATASAIAEYFARQMPLAGWSSDGASTETSLFFRKGALMLGVLMNRSGGTFTLMGS